MRKIGVAAALAVCAGLMLWAAGCASTTGPGAKPSDKMVMEQGTRNYGKVMIAPVEMTFDPESKDIEANPQEVQMLKDYMKEALAKQLKDKYKVVDGAGPGVMRVDVTITDVKKSDVLMHLHWLPKLLGLGLGGAAMQGHMMDSETGAELGEAFVSQRGNFFQLTEGLSKCGEAKAVMDAWAKEFRKKLVETRT